MEHGTLTQKFYMTKKIKNGTNNFRRRTLSINSCIKADDGTYIFIGRSRLHGPVRDTSSKVNRVRRHAKPTHHE